jgi:hypothetical protein
VKKRLLLFLLLVTFGATASLPALAQESPSLTDDHITRIQTNCQSAIATLNQIHANDTPVYINRNQAYFSISDKLIARLNSRLALNRFDTTPLVKIANDYNSELIKFRATYKEYDTAMADLVKRNCSKQPVGFYETVGSVRELRAEVHTVIAKLHELIDQYRAAVDVFEAENETKLRAVKND